jgi:hypothetical protein
MSTKKPPVRPTVAEMQAAIAEAESVVLRAQIELGEALVVQVAIPDRDVTAEEAALAKAKTRVEQLKAMLPIVAKAEAKALEEMRSKLADAQRKRLEKELQNLVKQAMHFAAHQANALSAWHRLLGAGAAAERLLFDHHRRSGAIPAALSAGSLRRMADQEICRIGLRPELEGGISAPGTNPRAVPLNFANAPRRLPGLENEIRQLIASIMSTAPAPLPRPVASEGPELPDGPECAPGGSVAAQTCGVEAA